MGAITWLHLSDLHFRASQSYDQNIVLKALIQDMRARVHDEHLQPDFLVFSGDRGRAVVEASYEERLGRELSDKAGLAMALTNQAALLAHEKGQPREALPLAMVETRLHITFMDKAIRPDLVPLGLTGTALIA